MPFWTYILHCKGGVFYTGHSDNLELRVAQHQSGEIEGFTSQYLPVELVWSQEFLTREEAKRAELQIKGWSRAKKLALIRGSWEGVSRLAKRKGGPSTSSGRTEEGEGGAHDPAQKEGRMLRGVLPESGRLDKALAEASGLSRERIKALMAEGKVLVGGVPVASASGKAQAGAEFVIHLPPPIDPQASPQDIPLVIAFEDEHLIVVDKPAGMVVHPAAGNPDGTLVNALLHHCAGRLSGIGGVARPGIVHRIDKDTSGLLVVAKSDAAHEGLSAQFADHSIERVYLAVAGGHPQPAAGTIDERVGRSDANRKKMAVLPKESSRGKRAVTHYKTLERLDSCALLECRLETGRTHQVRVHLASIGHPLVGDRVYGRTSSQLRPLLQELGFQRQALHAAVLGFIHPVTGERLSFASELPTDIRQLIDRAVHRNR